MKFSEKSQKKRDQGFTSSLENTVLEKPKGKAGGGSEQLPPPPLPSPNLLRFVFSPLIDSLIHYYAFRL